MSEEMRSQASDGSEYEQTDDEMDEEDIYNYYNDEHDDVETEQDEELDPEYFHFQLLKVRLLDRRKVHFQLYVKNCIQPIVLG